MHGRKNKENRALKLVDEIILHYDARPKKHQNRETTTCNFWTVEQLVQHHS